MQLQGGQPGYNYKSSTNTKLDKRGKAHCLVHHTFLPHPPGFYDLNGSNYPATDRQTDEMLLWGSAGRTACKRGTRGRVKDGREGENDGENGADGGEVDSEREH
ncbi:hypothetical protein MHYP_G00025670 [Metynnis hypsauchen]